MGIIFEKYRSGMNLGGWISQCSYEKKHIAEFIKEADVKKIASWGLDHIRLPIDYEVLESDDAPFQYLEEGFAVIDNALKWCKAAGLNLVMDLHKAPGYAFGNAAEDNILFTNDNAQKRFVSLWEEFAKRYKNEGDNVIFELLNEVVDPNGNTWNSVARRAIEAIHAIDPNRYVLLGGPAYNSVSTLQTLETYDTDRVLFNFHFYDPMYFTHQRSSWTVLRDTKINQPYPGKLEGLDALKNVFDEKTQFGPIEADVYFDIDYLERSLAPAIKFAKERGKELYCGEYGAIDQAELECRINYIRDTNTLFDKYGFGRALWSYKRMDFPSIDENGEPVSQELVKILSLK